VHGTAVVVVERPGEHAGAEADAAVTAAPGACLAVQTADCAPVLLAAADGSVVGAVHAGWRGLLGGVVEAAVGAMRDLGATGVSARLGPCISPAAYEFGSGDLTTLALRFGPDVVAATPDGAPALDLRAAVRQALRDAGVEDLDVSAATCTATDPGWFSWRARRDVARQASVTWIEP
jgi:YfiH family protein